MKNCSLLLKQTHMTLHQGVIEQSSGRTVAVTVVISHHMAAYLEGFTRLSIARSELEPIYWGLGLKILHSL